MLKYAVRENEDFCTLNEKVMKINRNKRSYYSFDASRKCHTMVSYDKRDSTNNFFTCNLIINGKIVLYKCLEKFIEIFRQKQEKCEAHLLAITLAN